MRSIAPVRGDRMVLVELRGGRGAPRSAPRALFGRRANLILMGAADRVIAMAAAPALKGRPGPAPSPWAAPGPRQGAGKAPLPPSADGLLEALGTPEDLPPGRVKGPAHRSRGRWSAPLGAAAAEAHEADARKTLRQRVKRRVARTPGSARWAGGQGQRGQRCRARPHGWRSLEVRSGLDQARRSRGPPSGLVSPRARRSEPSSSTRSWRPTENVSEALRSIPQARNERAPRWTRSWTAPRARMAMLNEAGRARRGSRRRRCKARRGGRRGRPARPAPGGRRAQAQGSSAPQAVPLFRRVPRIRDPRWAHV